MLILDNYNFVLPAFYVRLRLQYSERTWNGLTTDLERR